jgi:hypothetical protein
LNLIHYKDSSRRNQQKKKKNSKYVSRTRDKTAATTKKRINKSQPRYKRHMLNGKKKTHKAKEKQSPNVSRKSRETNPGAAVAKTEKKTKTPTHKPTDPHASFPFAPFPSSVK